MSGVYYGFRVLVVFVFCEAFVGSRCFYLAVIRFLIMGVFGSVYFRFFRERSRDRWIIYIINEDLDFGGREIFRS